MTATDSRNLVFDRPCEGVWVARFTRPDLRDDLYEDVDSEISPLYQELWTGLLVKVRAGQTVVLNFGLVEPFATAFYRCLLKVREVLAARGAQLILCQLSRDIEEVFHLLKGFRTFRVTATERCAVHESTAAVRA